MSQNITINIGNASFKAQLGDTATARAIYDALPVEAKAQRWGGEIYFEIPVECGLEENSRDVLNEGELGYWPTGSAFCIFFGVTPMSQGDEIRAASKVNVVGRVLSDLDKLWDVRNGEQITIDKT